METTLTLDDDIADALREKASLSGQPFEEVVNDTLRCGLEPSQPEELPPFRVEPLPIGFRPEFVSMLPSDLDEQLQLEHDLERLNR